MILATPIGPLFAESTQVLDRALGIFERLGDRTGVMSTVIAMAYAQYGTVMHFTSSARHLEEIRRVTSRLSELVTESERARLDLQMLFGVHVCSRAKVVPDLGAVARRGGPSRGKAPGRPGDRVPRRRRGGAQPARARRRRGGRTVARPGRRRGVDGAVATAARSSSRRGAAWPGRAQATPTACATTSSTPWRWRPRAVGRPRAARRWPASPSRRLGSSSAGRLAPDAAPDPALSELVERSAAQVKELLPLLPGHAPWGAQADAALSAVALARGDMRPRSWPAARPSRPSRPGSTRTSAWRS